MVIDVDSPDEEWRPVIRFDKEVPNYFVSTHGRVIGMQGRILKGRDHKGYLYIDLSVPVGFYPDYDYARSTGEYGKSKNRSKVRVAIHRIVMETFCPVNLNPPVPITLEEWNSSPKSMQNMVKDTVLVDHIDNNKANNFLSNLRWTTPKDNQVVRKKAMLELLQSKTVVTYTLCQLPL